MSIWHITGGSPLRGQIRVQGSKNAVLPVIAASLLCGAETELLNCPNLSDVDAAMDILRYLGCTAARCGDALCIDTTAPAAYMVIDEEYWLLDRSGKMLGTTDSLTAGEYPEIRSLEPMTVLEGEDMLVEGTNAERLAVLQTILPALRAEDVSSLVEWIDLRDPANPSLRYDGRLTVYLGAEGEMLYRIAMLKNVVSQLAAEDAGTLYYTNGSAWTFSPD